VARRATVAQAAPKASAPALVIGELVKFVGLAPSYESLVAALREAGLE